MNISIKDFGKVALLLLLAVAAIGCRYYVYEDVQTVVLQVMTAVMAAVATLMCLLSRRVLREFSRGEIWFYGLLVALFLFTCFSPYYTRYAYYTLGLTLGVYLTAKGCLTERNIPVWYAGLIVLGVSEAIYGLMQIGRTSLGLFGHFDNPAGFASFLSMILPLAWYVVFYVPKRPIRFIGLLCAGIMVVAIIFSKSRAGSLAAIVSTLAMIAYRYRFVWRRLSAKTKWMIVGLVVVIGIVGSFFLYTLKKDSADGRLLIWTNSLEMVGDKPLLGHGAGSFQANYMLYQAVYFQAHPDSVYADLADNVRRPFNEYLGLLIQFGIIGCFVFLICIIRVVKNSLKQPSPIHFASLASLIALAVSAFFTYPFYYVPIVLLACVNVSILSVKADFILPPVGIWCVRIGLVAGCVLASIPRHSENPFVLYSDGIRLNQQKDYAQSIEKLDRCKVVLLDADLALIQTDNHYELNDFQKAEQWADLAIHMCPNRFVPLYYKVMILSKTGRCDEAIVLARSVLEKSIKVRHSDVYKVRIRLERFLESESNR